jgi:5,10-methylene-tetrahydrofolate dehydrogenase/methenyl tetrahydrofolate cyclohydrolase
MAQVVNNEVQSEVEEWVASGHRRPHLIAVLVGNDPASATYVRNKMKAAEYTG